MRILMVGASHHGMMEDVRNGLKRDAVAEFRSHGHILFKDGSELIVKRVRDRLDLENLRGIYPDLIIEHDSFPRDLVLRDQLRAYTLR